MTSNLSAEMILATGPATMPVEKAIRTVKEVLCQTQGSSKEVYAIILWGAHRSADKPDHLSVMNSIISAAKNSWQELFKTQLRHRFDIRRSTSIEVIEHDRFRIYIGCGSVEEFKKSFIPREGIYFFPSHIKVNTLTHLGLTPLPNEVKSLPIVVQVGIEKELPETSPSQELDRETRAWREHFISEYKGLSAAEVADEAGNTAKNRSALASRWASEKKIFGVRFQNQILYPAFQFRDGEPILAIEEVLKEMAGSFTGWDVAFFFTSPNSYLDGKRPLDILKSKPERVIQLAHAFAHPADVF